MSIKKEIPLFRGISFFLFSIVNPAEWGHTWDEGKVTKKATCTKDGVKTYTCENCGQTKTETIKAHGHQYKNGICQHCGVKIVIKPTMPIKPVWGNIWGWIGGWWK